MKTILWNMKDTVISALLLILGYFLKSDVILALAIIIGGYKQTKEGIMDTIENKNLNVELLMILSAIGASLIGFYLEGAVLIFIFSLSGALEAYTLDQSKREIRALMELQPTSANRLLSNGSVETVAVELLKPKDIILVAVGETIPIDARIIKGKSSIEEAAITGESMPKEKSINDSVFGGTLNISSPLTLEVSTDSSDTLIQKIVRMVEEAQQYPSKTAHFIEKLENKYAWFVLIFVFLVILIPITVWNEPFESAFYRGMILLVVASPCALIASVTPATLAAISNGAKKGILVKGGIHFENLIDIKAVAFDKTGTLTVGLPSLSDILIEDKSVLEGVLALENFSSHPLASAIVKGLMSELNLDHYPEADDVQEVPGHGVVGCYLGKSYRVGNADHMTVDLGIHKAEADDLSHKGKSLVYVQVDDEVVGVLGLMDQVRSDAKALVDWLNKEKIDTIMVTGDNEETAKHIAEQIGITRYIAESLPQEKAQLVKDLEEEYGSVIMIGDGINDAPALANASIGIAMGGGTDIAIEAADIILVKDQLSSISQAITLSRRLRRIVIQNIVFSFSVILILVFSNFFNIVNLPLGVVGHEGSTILVILNSLRLLRK